MKTLKTLSLTLILCFGFIIPSCNDDDLGVDCDCSKSQYFDVVGLEAPLFFRDSFFNEQVDPNDTLQLEELGGGIRITYEVFYHAFAEPKSSFSFSLMNTANACSCLGGYSGSKMEMLEDFSIVTINDFDDQHPAGSSINDLLTYRGNSFDFNANVVPLTDVVNEMIGKRLAFYDLWLHVQKAPELNAEFKIKVVLKLTNGESYEIEAMPITLLP